jgi:hypothetical protein
MMTYEDAEAHAKGLINAWNAHDLDKIMLHYSQNVIFEAETVEMRWNNPSIHGIEELRKHFAFRFRAGTSADVPSGTSVPRALWLCDLVSKR